MKKLDEMGRRYLVYMDEARERIEDQIGAGSSDLKDWVLVARVLRIPILQEVARIRILIEAQLKNES